VHAEGERKAIIPRVCFAAHKIALSTFVLEANKYNF
jgi:hypothetical protein